MSDLCGEWTGSRVDLDTGEVRAGAIWCKSWTCEYCAPIRLRQLQAQAVNGEPNKFITLTSRYRPDEMTPDDAAKQLVHAWRMVVQRGKREGRFKSLQYIAVFELTQKGWPHLHILARCDYIAQAWLSDRLAQYANSPRVDIRAVKGKRRAAFYIAKYVSKGPDKFNGCKRYWRTHGYDLSEDRRDKCLHDHFLGYLSQSHVTEVAHFYRLHDYAVAWEGDNSFIAIPAGLTVHRKQMDAHRRKRTTPYKERQPCA